MIIDAPYYPKPVFRHIAMGGNIVEEPPGITRKCGGNGGSKGKSDYVKRITEESYYYKCELTGEYCIYGKCPWDRLGFCPATEKELGVDWPLNVKITARLAYANACLKSLQ